MWVAPTDEVVRYRLAARAAKITVSKGMVSVTLPDNLPSSALTLKLTGINPTTVFAPPANATMYRQGSIVWLTTPTIGKPGTLLSAPHVHRIYTGPLKDLVWDKPVRIAGVRIRQFGPGTPGFVFQLDTITPEGKVLSLTPGGGSPLKAVWGGWNLYSVIPDRPAIPVKELHVTPGKDLNEMEVWAVLPD